MRRWAGGIAGTLDGGRHGSVVCDGTEESESMSTELTEHAAQSRAANSHLPRRWASPTHSLTSTLVVLRSLSAAVAVLAGPTP